MLIGYANKNKLGLALLYLCLYKNNYFELLLFQLPMSSGENVDKYLLCKGLNKDTQENYSGQKML